MPQISVITVVYNACGTVGETISSVLKQTYNDFEYIIVDGGSTDDTIDIVKKNESAVLKWISEPDRGVYDAMNKGIKMSRGQWIYFLGADDVFYDDKVLENVAKHLTDNKTVVYGNVLFKEVQKIYDGRFNGFKIVTRNISHQAIFYPRTVFDSYQFDLRYKVYADYHLNLVLFGNQRWRFKYIPLVITIFNDKGISGSMVPDPEFERDRHRIIRENFSLPYYLYRTLRTKAAAIFKR